MSFVELPVLWDIREDQDEEVFSLSKTQPDFIHVNPAMVFSVSDSPDAPECSVITEPSGRGFLIPLTTSEVIARLTFGRNQK